MTYSAPLIGQVCATQLEWPDAPVWAPLERIARLARITPELPSFHEAEFMYMSAAREVQGKLLIHLYKHRDTREYLNLDRGGHAYAYCGPASDGRDGTPGGGYRRYGR